MDLFGKVFARRWNELTAEEKEPYIKKQKKQAKSYQKVPNSFLGSVTSHRVSVTSQWPALATRWLVSRSAG